MTTAAVPATLGDLMTSVMFREIYLYSWQSKVFWIKEFYWKEVSQIDIPWAGRREEGIGFCETAHWLLQE